MFTQKHSFSATQSTLLSKEAPSTISFPAFGISAVSSTITGGFPGPAAIHFFPVFIATLTTASPPVTLSSFTFGWFIITALVSRLGFAGQQISPMGPPAAAIASFKIRMASWEHFTAAGWGLNTTAFPAAIMLIELLITVPGGLVEGVMEPITPKGACSTSVIPLSPVNTRGTISSVPGVLFATSRIFAILSGTFPYPVSSWAIWASFFALSLAA